MCYLDVGHSRCYLSDQPSDKGRKTGKITWLCFWLAEKIKQPLRLASSINLVGILLVCAIYGSGPLGWSESQPKNTAKSDWLLKTCSFQPVSIALGNFWATIQQYLTSDPIHRISFEQIDPRMSGRCLSEIDHLRWPFVIVVHHHKPTASNSCGMHVDDANA